ncbi:MAG: hypothetical protein QOI27_1745 [Gaiellaceae bacterium]|nr:hypothetical protein [Gaiellaceae bacterium]MDX6469625.1 hypothetical protein [Gaiellaceae bacterium]
MKKHRFIPAAALAAALVAASAASAASADPGGKPLPPAQAQALIAAPAAVASGSATRSVTGQEALAAASAAGAVVSVAPGLSLQQAVGLVPTPGGPTRRSYGARRASGYTACSANSAWYEWGTWPYQQRITDTTYWCAVYGERITYTSSTSNGSGTFCSTSWTSSQLIGGGIGYSWFVTRSSAGFSCPTAIPWISLHPSHYEDVARNAWGSTALVGAS